MNLRVIGVYREPEFSPGKVDADAAIIDGVLDCFRGDGAQTETVDAIRFAEVSPREAQIVIAMCQGAPALSRLAAFERAGALVVNSPLAIRNCYRDLLGAGLMHAGIPTPEGALVRTSQPLDLKPLRVLDISSPMYVKRGDLHALGPHDVQRVQDLGQLEATLLRFARRGIETVYVQQEALGEVVKFYGVAGGNYFSVVAEGGLELSDMLKRSLASAAGAAAAALGLEVWGGDALVKGDTFKIVDFNDWPSFERVRNDAAAAIARRCQLLLRRHSVARDISP